MNRSRDPVRHFSRSLLLCGALSLFCFSATSALTEAAAHPEINYQGKLTDASNVAVADGVYHMRFWLLTSPSIATTSAVWSEDRSTAAGDRIRVENGLFSVMLGSSTPLTSVDFNQTLYLGVEVGGSGGSPSWDGEMSPRKVLSAVPAAFEADNLDGLDSTQFLRSDEPDTLASSSASTLLTVTQSGTGDILNLFDGATEVFSVLDGGNIGIGTTSPFAKLSVAGGDIHVGGIITSTSTSATSTLPWLSSTRLALGGQLFDSAGSAGTTGMVLQSTGSATTWVATSSLNIAAGITAIGPTGQTSDGPTVTFATSSDTNIGLTITGSGDTQTFTSTWTGTLADARVADAITVSGGTLSSNSVSGTWTTTGTLTIGDGGDRIDIASSGWDVTNSVITGATWQGGVIATDYGGTGVGATPLSGELLIGDGAGFTLTTLSQGAGITITNGAGSISIACNVASGSVAGCLSTANWTTFNNKVSSTSIDTSAELAALITDETGSGPVVFSASPTLTGTAAFAALTTTGNVGIGTTSPGYKLDVYGQARLGAANPALYLTGTKSGGNEWFLQSVDSDGRFRIYDQTTNAERMTLTQSGNVGIGTTSPSQALSVGGSGYLSGGLGVGRSHGTAGEIWASSHVLADGAVYGAYSAGSGIAFAVGNDTTIRDIDTANTLAIYGASDNAVASLKLGSGGGTISGAGGNVGIGTTSPLAKLHVSGAGGLGGAGLFESTDSYNSLTIKGVNGGGVNDSAILWFKDQADENTLIGLVGTASAGAGEVGDLRFIVDNSERMRIAKDGGIGIGVINPGAPLDVSGTGANQCCATFVPTLSLAESGAIRNPSIQFHSSGFQEAYLRLASSTRSLDIGDSQGVGTALGVMNAAGTSRAVSISGSASSYFNGGNVGIGTTTPQSMLAVAGANGSVEVNDGGDQLSFTRNNFNYITAAGSSATLRVQASGASGALSLLAGDNISLTTNSAERMRVTSAGNVGIGTTTPDDKLWIDTGTGAWYKFAGDGGGYPRLYMGGTSSGVAGVFNRINAAATFFFGEGADTGGIIFRGNGAFVVEDETSTKFYVDPNGGNVGIGSTSPSYKLSIDTGGSANGFYMTTGSGQIAFRAQAPGASYFDLYNTSAASGAKFIRFANNGGALAFEKVNDAYSSATELMRLDAATGYLGIGTTTPTGTLHVVGGTSASTHGTDVTLAAQNGYTGNPFLATNGGNIILLPGAKSGAGTDGNVGIGTANPNEGKVEVKGGTVCVDTNSDDNASSCIASESDERLKTNILSLQASSSLEAILALNPVSFDWRTTDLEVLEHYPLIARFASSPHSIGLIAQEVTDIVPEAIGTETVGDDEVRYFQLDYTKFVPVIISAVQEVYARLVELTEHVAALIESDSVQDARLGEQNERIAELEAQVRSLLERIADDDDDGAEPDDDDDGAERDDDPDSDPEPGPATLPPDPAMDEPPVEAPIELEAEFTASDTHDVVDEPPVPPSEPAPVADPVGGVELSG